MVPLGQNDVSPLAETKFETLSYDSDTRDTVRGGFGVSWNGTTAEPAAGGSLTGLGPGMDRRPRLQLSHERSVLAANLSN